ncbi:MAG: hypothetical protein FJX72_13000 [Armatimonadetes bacterium]|nr:hypothetical protein [Armatimonadota bacterium]
MYRQAQSRSLYRDVARRVWERYRPSLLDIPVGVSLLRDPTVDRRRKLGALTIALAVAAVLFGMQWLLAWSAGLRGPVSSLLVELTLAAGVLALVAPLALVRIAAPEQVVRVRLRKVRVIPLRKS